MAGLFGRMFGPSVTRAAGTPVAGLIPPLGSVQSASGLLISQATAMTVSTVYACVNRLATDLARCTPSLYTRNADGSRTPVTKHPLLDIFERPNRQQTWFEFSWQMWVGHLLRGNGYAAIMRDRKAIEKELIPINPDAVMVLEASDGSVFYNVNRIGLWQIAMLRDFPTAIPEEDVLHLRGLTFNTLVGVSTIGLGRDAIGLTMGLEQQANRLVGNGARPSGVLKSPKQLSEIAAARLRAQWNEFSSGLLNVGKTAVLEDGVTWEKMQLDAVSQEFMAQRNWQPFEVCRFFGVPPHKVGIVDRGTVQNIAAQDQDYVNTSVSQKLVLAEQKFRQVFNLDREGIYVDLDETQLLRADIMTRRNAARLGILSGITTQNEERRAEGLPPMPGGDVLLVPANTAAMGSDATGTAADGAGRPQGKNPPEPGVSTSGDQPNAEPIAGDAAPQN